MKLTNKILDKLQTEANEAFEACPRRIMIMDCGEPVTTVFTHKSNKSDVNRMCSSCAFAIRDTSDYTCETVDPHANAYVEVASSTLLAILAKLGKLEE